MVKSLLSFLYLVTPPKTMAPTTRPLQPSNQRPTIQFVAALGTVTADLERDAVSTVKVLWFLLTSHCRSCGLCWCYKTMNKEKTWKNDKRISSKIPHLTIWINILPSQQSVTACSEIVNRYVLPGAEFQHLEEIFLYRNQEKTLNRSFLVHHKHISASHSDLLQRCCFLFSPFCSTLSF